jgi:hypothetical protein
MNHGIIGANCTINEIAAFNGSGGEVCRGSGCGECGFEYGRAEVAASSCVAAQTCRDVRFLETSTDKAVSK